jgi:glycosyltransferase involved in cell wall biosynthesis
LQLKNSRVLQKILMRWQASSLFGWGLLGLNLFQRWAADPDIQPLMGVRLQPRDVPGIDPLRFTALQPAFAASNEFLDALTAGKVDPREQGVVVIDGFGSELAPAALRTGPLGVLNIARCVFEDTRLDNANALEAYDNLLCASEWNADLLRTASGREVTVIHEGIDHSLFFPGPRSGVLDPECFYIFTGGKIEFRKAQDLVLLAFREFAARHDDAVLVAAWNSPWPAIADGFQFKLPVPLRLDPVRGLDLRRWVAENGIPPHQFMELPLTPNFTMPAVLREMDCALQVSRAEACTSLPVKEAMACGVPVIVANNTGMRDLVEADNCLALNTQDRVYGPPDLGTESWGESRVEEIVEALEKLYTDTQLRKRMGARGAEWILQNRRTWRDHATSLKSHIQTLL